MCPFTILDHPADIGIEARGATLPEAFEQAAAGMMSIIVDPSTVGKKEARVIDVAGSDHEQILVRWLSELLYQYDGRGFVGREFCVEQLTPLFLRASVQGETFDPERHATRLDVKAVTYHQVAVEENAGGAVVRVYFDI